MNITKCSSSRFEPRHYVTYHQWSSTIGPSRRSTCILLTCQLSKTGTSVTLLTRFRSGYHWLEICQGRYSKTPRDMRCCPNCTGVNEDEHHALFDCPMYDVLRGKFSDLFHDDCRTLVKKLFSNDQDYTKLARFLTLCRERRVQKSV